MRISDWSSDVCSSDLYAQGDRAVERVEAQCAGTPCGLDHRGACGGGGAAVARGRHADPGTRSDRQLGRQDLAGRSLRRTGGRSEEHTSELQSLMRNSYAVFCLKKKKKQKRQTKMHSLV